jgi:hypothetical protein
MCAQNKSRRRLLKPIPPLLAVNYVLGPLAAFASDE